MTLLSSPRAATPRDSGRAWRQRAPGLPLAGCLLLAIGLRLPFVGTPHGVDEGGVAWVARQWGAAHGSLYGGQWLDRPPLLVALFRSVQLAGLTGVRVLGALAALLVVAGCFAIADRLAGPTAARIAGVLAALTTGSLALGAVYSPGELLAAAPATISVAMLVLGIARQSARPFVAAGALAVAALLIKQSALDAAAAAGALLLAVWRLHGYVAAVRYGRAYLSGVALGLVPLAAWMAAAGVSPGALYSALLGFRTHSLAVLQGSGASLGHRLAGLETPALGSGLVVLVPLAAVAMARLGRRSVFAWLLAGWLLAGVLAVAAGGSYWPHYLIELVPASAVGAGVVLADRPRRVVRGTLVVLCAAAALVASVGGIDLRRHPHNVTQMRVAAFIHHRARPGDTFDVLYARADLNDLVGLPTPFAYSWSLMMRARADARPRLLAMLDSRARPTWIVEWQAPGSWGLDRDGRITAALRANYRRVATFGGHPLLHAVPPVTSRAARADRCSCRSGHRRRSSPSRRSARRPPGPTAARSAR